MCSFGTTTSYNRWFYGIVILTAFQACYIVILSSLLYFHIVKLVILACYIACCQLFKLCVTHSTESFWKQVRQSTYVYCCYMVAVSTIKTLSNISPVLWLNPTLDDSGFIQFKLGVWQRLCHYVRILFICWQMFSIYYIIVSNLLCNDILYRCA